MKKSLLIMILGMISLLSFGQEKEFLRLFTHFEEMKGVESVSISPTAFASFVNDSAKESKELFKKMESLKILSVSKNENKEAANSLYTAMTHFIQKYKLEQVMKIKDDKDVMLLYHKDRVLVFLTTSDNDVSVLYVGGNIDKDLIKAVMEGKISFK